MTTQTASTSMAATDRLARIRRDTLPSTELQQMFIDDELIRVITLNGGRAECQTLGPSPSSFSIDSDSLQFVEKPQHNGAFGLRVSVAPYEGELSDDLRFDAQQLIAVEQLEGEWARGYVVGDNGRLLGKPGLFPINFTVQIDSSQPNLTDITPTAEAETAPEISPNAPIATVSAAESSQRPEYPHCRAFYGFNADYDGELSFRTGQIIRLIRKLNADWFEGELVDEKDGSTKKGVFPANHVEIIVNLEPTADEMISDTELESRRYGAFQTEEPHTIGFATVLHDFVARYEDELSAEAGFSVRVVQMNEEWAVCWNPVTGHQGLLPQSFLQIFLDDDDADFTTMGSQTMDWSSGGGAPDFGRSAKSDTTPWGDPFGSATLPTSAGSGRSPTNSVSAVSHDPTTAANSTNLSSMAADAISSVSAPAASNQSAIDDDFRALFGLQPDPTANNSTAPKPTAPSRPPPPRPNAPTFVVANRRPVSPPKLSSGHKFPGESLMTLAEAVADGPRSWRDQFNKVVEDLLHTEVTYNTELFAWEKAIVESTELSEQRKCVLTNGYPMLKDLSQRIVRRITDEMDKPCDRQCYGQMFMDLREKMSKTYAYHFRCVEEIADIIDKKDPQLQEALKRCVAKMAAAQVFMFDVPTAIARPIQRCLRYPLFIGELLKILPITHIDHPKLLEAQKQMNTLVSKMNESKRRKELMQKYRDDRKSSFLDQLAKVNMHTFVKKSNRLKYRLAASMGFVANPDAEFSSMIAELDQSERRLCKFLYSVQLYRSRVNTMTKKYVGAHTVVPKKINSPADEPLRWEFNGYLKKLSTLMKEYRAELQQSVVLPCTQLQKCEYNRLIVKRCDKLADYDVARLAKRESEEEIERKRCEFEALNRHIKTNLPRIWQTINERVAKLAQMVVELDEQFINRVNAHLAQLPLKLHVFSLPDFNTFMDPHNQRLHMIQKHLTNGASSADEANRKASRKNLRKSMRIAAKNNEPGTNIQLRPQTGREREALIKVLRIENRVPDLRRVICDYTSPRIVLKKHDVVVILRFSEDGYCVCENGVGSDRVPFHALAPFEDSFSYSAPPSPPTDKKAFTNGVFVTGAEAEPSKPTAITTTASGGRIQQPLVKQQNLSDAVVSLTQPRPYPPNNMSTLSHPPLPQRQMSPLELISYDEEPKSALSFAALASRSQSFSQSTPVAWTTFDSGNGSPPRQENPTTPKAPNGYVNADTIDSTDPFADLFRSALQTNGTPLQSNGLSNGFTNSQQPGIPAIPAPPRAPVQLFAQTSIQSTVPTAASSTSSGISSSFSTPSMAQRTPTPPQIPQRSELTRTPLPNPVAVSATMTPREVAEADSSFDSVAPSEFSTAASSEPQQREDPIYDSVFVSTQSLAASSNASEPLYEVPPFAMAALDEALSPRRANAAPPSLPTTPRPANLNKSAPVDIPPIYVCEFDFSPVEADSNQLWVRENQRVRVARRHDEAGNHEWWLVECLDGNQKAAMAAATQRRGYVPSAYLRPATTFELMAV